MAINVRICATPSKPFGCKAEDYETAAYQVIGHDVKPGWFDCIEDAVEYIESYVYLWYEHEVNRYRHGWIDKFPDKAQVENGWSIVAIGRKK